MTEKDMQQIRQIFREELAALFGSEPQAPAETAMDAEHVARMILEGRGAEVKKRQHLKLTGRAA